MLEIGTKAPDFTLLNQDGKEVHLSDFLGKKVILYFYPKVIHQDVQNKLVILLNYILTLQKMEP